MDRRASCAASSPAARRPAVRASRALQRSPGSADSSRMFWSSARWIAIYGVGLVLIWGWAISHALAGTVTRENFALVLVLPLAWTFSFPGMATSLILIQRVRGLQRLLAELGARVQGGAPTEEQERELEETFTALAARENGLPELLVRPFVRRTLHLLLERARAERAQLS